MITTNARKCMINNSGQIINHTIGEVAEYKINEARIIRIINVVIPNYPDIKQLIIVEGFIGFLLDYYYQTI